MIVPVIEEKVMVIVLTMGVDTDDAVMDCATSDKMVTVLA
jgi:hypothetical protein